MEMLKFSDVLTEDEITEKGKKMSDKEYEKFFDSMLKKYKVKDPSELSTQQKKKFFDELDKGAISDKGE